MAQLLCRLMIYVTPLESKNHPIEKEHHLPNLHFWVPSYFYRVVKGGGPRPVTPPLEHPPLKNPTILSLGVVIFFRTPCPTLCPSPTPRWSICSWKTRCAAGHDPLELEIFMVFSDPQKSPKKIPKQPPGMYKTL